MPTLTAREIGELPVLKTDTFLDELTGIWGLPKKRIIEFYGAEKTGKSTASFHVIASAQKQGLRCLLVDIEHSVEIRYLEKMGIDLDTLGIIQAEFAEEYIDQTIEAIDSGKWDVIIFDSIGSLSSRVEHEKAAGERTIGLQSNMMATLVRKIAPKISLRNLMFIGINHSRQDIMTGKNITMGGRAWSEKKKLSIEFREVSGKLLSSGKDANGKDKIIGKVINVRVMKNAVGPTERKEMNLHLIFGVGFSMANNIAQEAIDKGVIEKKGNSYFFNDEKVAVGLPKLREWVKENEDKIKECLS